jgi:penicillin-binding protein 2B
MKGKDFGIKTGTAQIAKATGGYMTGDRNYIFSVVGITPTDNPRYCIYITMKQPSKLGSGAETILSQIFKPMMRRLVLLSKGNKSATGAVTVPKLTGMTVAKAKSTASANGLTIVKLGTGSKVTSQNAKAGATVSAGSTVFVSTGGKLTMPDLTGYSQSQVEAFAELTGLKLTLSGSGKVKLQSLDAGTTIKAGTKLKVELKE